MHLTHRNWRAVFSLKVNDVVRTLTISDFFILSGFGLIAPIFAVFLTDNIEGGSVEVVGIAATIFLLTRSLGQIPVAYVIDKIKGENDDFQSLVIGSIISSFVPIMYIFARNPWHIYIIQLIFGFSQALTYPSWYAIFTRHVDNHKEGFEWGVYSTLTDLGGAAVAGIGGYVALTYGFTPLFITVSIMSLIGSFWIYFIKVHLVEL